MKKFLILFVILASIFSFYSSLTKYETDLQNQRIPGVQYLETSQLLLISGHLTIEQERSFYSDFVTVLRYHDVSTTQMFFDPSQHLSIYWVYTADMSALQGFRLRDGLITQLKPSDVYSSIPEEGSGTIFLPRSNQEIRLYHLENRSDPNSPTLGDFWLFTSHEDYTQRFRDVVMEMRSLYPHIHFDDSSMGSFGAGWVIPVEYNDIFLMVLLGILVILGFNVILLQHTKKIQIMVLEGYSRWELYRIFVLKNVAQIAVIFLLCNILFYTLYIRTTLTNGLPMIYFMSLPFVIFMGSLIFLSMMSFLLILSMNTNLSIKGKSNLQKQKYINYAIKVLLILFSTFIVLQGFDSIHRFVRMMRLESQFITYTTGIHQIGTNKPGLSIVDMMEFFDPEKRILFQERLEREGNAFVNKGLFPMEHESSDTRRILSNVVSKDFLMHYMPTHVSEQFVHSENFVLIPESLSAYEDDIMSWVENQQFFLWRAQADIIRYNEYVIPTISPYSFLQFGLYVNDVVYIVSEAWTSIGSVETYFMYDGDGQALVDRLHEEIYGVPFFHIVSSIADIYSDARSEFLEELHNLLPIFLLIFITIITNVYQLAILNVDMNEKKYAIQKTDGEGTFYLIRYELLCSAIILLIAAVCMQLFMEFPLPQMLWILSLYMVLEVVVLYSVTHVKLRRFAEILR